MEHAKIDPKDGFALAFGDQRELLESDWPVLLDMMAGLAAQRDRPLPRRYRDIVDMARTGQFRTLAEPLRKLEGYPTAVAGNRGRRTRRVRRARTLPPSWPRSASRSPPTVFTTRRWSGGFGSCSSTRTTAYDGGFGVDAMSVATRAHAQLDWLVHELTDPAFGPNATTVVIMHHPFHTVLREAPGPSAETMESRYHGRRLADIFADGGVDSCWSGTRTPTNDSR